MAAACEAKTRARIRRVEGRGEIYNRDDSDSEDEDGFRHSDPEEVREGRHHYRDNGGFDDKFDDRRDRPIDPRTKPGYRGRGTPRGGRGRGRGRGKRKDEREIYEVDDDGNRIPDT